MQSLGMLRLILSILVSVTIASEGYNDAIGGGLSSRGNLLPRCHVLLPQPSLLAWCEVPNRWWLVMGLDVWASPLDNNPTRSFKLPWAGGLFEPGSYTTALWAHPGYAKGFAVTYNMRSGRFYVARSPVVGDFKFRGRPRMKDSQLRAMGFIEGNEERYNLDRYDRLHIARPLNDAIMPEWLLYPPKPPCGEAIEVLREVGERALAALDMPFEARRAICELDPFVALALSEPSFVLYKRLPPAVRESLYQNTAYIGNALKGIYRTSLYGQAIWSDRPVYTAKVLQFLDASVREVVKGMLIRYASGRHWAGSKFHATQAKWALKYLEMGEIVVVWGGSSSSRRGGIVMVLHGPIGGLVLNKRLGAPGWKHGLLNMFMSPLIFLPLGGKITAPATWDEYKAIIEYRSAVSGIRITPFTDPNNRWATRRLYEQLGVVGRSKAIAEVRGVDESIKERSKMLDEFLDGGQGSD